VYIGINDVWHREKGCGTPEKQYSLGLEELVMRIQSAGSRILLCTPSVIGEKTGEINPYDPSLDVYSEITRTVARKTGCALLDLRRLFRDYLKLRNPGNRDRGILTRDGVHLNDRGNRMVARWIEAALGLRPCGETQSGEKGGP
jgi:lysophospholipase L1-like esterase